MVSFLVRDIERVVAQLASRGAAFEPIDGTAGFAGRPARVGVW